MPYETQQDVRPYCPWPPRLRHHATAPNPTSSNFAALHTTPTHLVKRRSAVPPAAVPPSAVPPYLPTYLHPCDNAPQFEPQSLEPIDPWRIVCRGYWNVVALRRHWLILKPLLRTEGLFFARIVFFSPVVIFFVLSLLLLFFFSSSPLFFVAHSSAFSLLFCLLLPFLLSVRFFIFFFPLFSYLVSYFFLEEFHPSSCLAT
jgi:hypothetical protein